MSDAEPAPMSMDSGRGIKTVGFIGIDNLVRAILEGFAHFVGQGDDKGRRWTKAVYMARVQSAASDETPLWRLPEAASIERAISLNLKIVEDEALQVAVQSDLIILVGPPDVVLATLREKGIAIALSAKVLVSVAPGVTITEMYDALYLGNRSPSPVEGSEPCFISRARPTLNASVGRSATLLVLPEEQLHHESVRRSKVDFVRKFFSGLGNIREVEESQIDDAP